MPRVSLGLARMLMVAGLGLALAAGTAPAFAKPGGNGGGNQGNGNGNGGPAGGGPAGGGPAGGGPAGGGPAGGGPAGGGPAGGGPAGGGAAGGGAQAAGAASAAAGSVDPGGQSDAPGGVNRATLGHAVVALNATDAAPHPAAPPEQPLQQMADYDRMMLAALRMPDGTWAEHAARERAIAGARMRLAAATNRRLNFRAVARIDIALGLPPADPHLGVR